MHSDPVNRHCWRDAVARRQTMRMLGLTCIAAGLAVFLWAKLRLVSDLPKTAYAQPESERAAPEQIHVTAGEDDQ